MASFVILILAFSLLGFSAWASISQWGPVGADGSLSDGTNNSGPHGFAEILYAFSSATGNNGSAFAGLSANTHPGITRRWGSRCSWAFCDDRPDPGAGRIARSQEAHSRRTRHLPGFRSAFTILLIGTVLLVGALTYFPALVLGPIIEHFLMHAGKLF